MEPSHGAVGGGRRWGDAEEVRWLKGGGEIRAEEAGGVGEGSVAGGGVGQGGGGRAEHWRRGRAKEVGPVEAVGPGVGGVVGGAGRRRQGQRGRARTCGRGRVHGGGLGADQRRQRDAPDAPTESTAAGRAQHRRRPPTGGGGVGLKVEGRESEVGMRVMAWPPPARERRKELVG
uniref:DUF834 domain-containing protein n=1 Tax=Setaria viridis TaxID=4556 RepID=A0A4U6T422_SETVI|nr:hypothetical protein SEVIR_9G424400v2 [Setaria viridis]